MGDEAVPFGAGEEAVEVPEEVEAFFVGDAGEGVVGVLAFEVGD